MRAFRFRYTLRGLLLFMVVIGGWCAFHSSRARLQQRVERAVIAAGGRVTCGPVDLADGSKAIPLGWYGGLVRKVFGERHISVVHLNNCPASADLIEGVSTLPHLQSFLARRIEMDDAKLTLLLRNRRLQRLELLDNPAISDVGCQSLPRLRHLKWLDLDKSQVSDTTLDRILKLEELERINLSRTNVTGKGIAKRKGLDNLRSFYAEKCKLSDDLLEWLSKCPNLQLAYLDDTGITDAGVEHFAGHPSLSRIVLSNNRLVTDKSFEYLAGCPRLKHLATGRGITRAGIENFRKRRPDVELR